MCGNGCDAAEGAGLPLPRGPLSLRAQPPLPASRAATAAARASLTTAHGLGTGHEEEPPPTEDLPPTVVFFGIPLLLLGGIRRLSMDAE